MVTFRLAMRSDPGRTRLMFRSGTDSNVIKPQVAETTLDCVHLHTVARAGTLFRDWNTVKPDDLKRLKAQIDFLAESFADGSGGK
jgi:hypothetical protein